MKYTHIAISLEIFISSLTPTEAVVLTPSAPAETAETADTIDYKLILEFARHGARWPGKNAMHNYLLSDQND